MKLRWQFGIIAGLFLAIFSLYPQGKMLYLRGADWNGHYAYNDIDEVAYAAYLKALIDGRPRKNDPYTGRDHSAEHPQPESLFSIQFAAPYTIAIPARLIGMDAPWAMTISGAIAAFLTSLALFWLIGMLTGDSVFAMAASLVVLAGGALFAGEGAIGEILGHSYSYPYFPGFRRYVPAMAFPAFFVLIGLVWRLVGDRSHEHVAVHRERGLLSADAVIIGLSAIAFGYAVFSYFYVWTTAAAWLGCLGLCWIVGRPHGFGAHIRSLLWLAAGCAAFIAPYAYLLSKRSHTMDEVQMLVRTHAPDLTRPPEVISYAVIGAVFVAVMTGTIRLRERSTLFVLSLAMTPIVVFNQQVITGQSLQPIHYQVFIGNYVAGLAAVAALGLIWRELEIGKRTIGRLAAAAMAIVAAFWGFVECHYTVRILDDVNIARDEAYPIGRRLTELGKEDPNVHQRVVLHFDTAEADDLPTIAPQSVLWARHQHVFAGVTWEENKERYYQQLYYQGVSPQQLADGMKQGRDLVSMIALFGWGRHTDRLNAEYKPLAFWEIDAEVAKFAAFSEGFDPSEPGLVRLDYLVVSDSSGSNLMNVDRWYERSDGEKHGRYTFYKLAPRK